MKGVTLPRHPHFTISNHLELFIPGDWTIEAGYVPEPKERKELREQLAAPPLGFDNIDLCEFNQMRIAYVDVRDLPRVYLDGEHLRPVPDAYYNSYVIYYVLFSGGAVTDIVKFFEHHLASCKTKEKLKIYLNYVIDLVDFAYEGIDVETEKHLVALKEVNGWCLRKMRMLEEMKNDTSQEAKREVAEKDQQLLLNVLIRAGKPLSASQLGVTDSLFEKLLARLLSRDLHNVKSALGKARGKQTKSAKQKAVDALKEVLINESANGSVLYASLLAEEGMIQKLRK